MGKVGIGSDGWVLLLPSFVGLANGQSAVGREGTGFQVGWGWSGLVWLCIERNLNW